MIYTIKDIVFDKGIVKPTCYYTSYIIETWIRTSTIEDIVMNVDILCLVLRVRLSITYQPDSRPISVMDSIIVYFYIVNNTCRFFNLNSWIACTPVIERVDYVIMKFYVV